jgi:uncharacterized protein
MDRRNIFKAAIAVGAGMLAAWATSRVRAETTSYAVGVPRVAYHLADLEKVGFVLANIRNHVEGMGAHDKVRIALVVHEPALKAFRANTPNMAIKFDVDEMRGAGVPGVT